MDFRPLNDTERRRLISALRGNAEHGLADRAQRRAELVLAWVVIHRPKSCE